MFERGQEVDIPLLSLLLLGSLSHIDKVSSKSGNILLVSVSESNWQFLEYSDISTERLCVHGTFQEAMG